MKPGILAMRAVNQYRTRDVIPYLGLRYYLESSCARRDRWASEVSVHLTQTRSTPAYFEAKHFKEMLGNGQILHRSIFLPGPNEALAEAALLAECSRHSIFQPLPSVYSYRLAKENDSSGIFEPYFSGFRQRHNDVANACQALGNGVVLYTDIKKFYPSVQAQQASEVWWSSCRGSGISEGLSQLGQKLLDDHASTCERFKQGQGLLTGPMFSHVIANQLLRPVDEAMAVEMPGRYFRYVDDVILVGSADEVKAGHNRLIEMLGSLHLALHDHEGEKTFSVDAAGWLKGAKDFDNDDGKEWMLFISDLRRYLIAKPYERERLATLFAAEGFNIPIPNFMAVANESWSMQRLSDFLKRYRWAGKAIGRISDIQLLSSAKRMRDVFADHLNRLLQINPDIRGFDRKRLIPKLRYFGGRLLYLGTPEMLTEFSRGLNQFGELRLLATVLRSVATRDVSDLLPLGSNAVQSAAQVLRLSREPVRCALKTFGAAEMQGVAILRMNGVRLSEDYSTFPENDAMNQFSLETAPMAALMKSDDPFVQELACLHGIEGPARHSSVLDTAFDRDEQMAFDVLNQLSQSGYT